MLKISEEHAAVFRELEQADISIQAILHRAMREATEMQKELQVKAKAHWAEVMEHYGIEGNWGFRDGKLFPVPDQQPSPQGMPPQDGEAAPMAAV